MMGDYENGGDPCDIVTDAQQWLAFGRRSAKYRHYRNESNLLPDNLKFSGYDETKIAVLVIIVGELIGRLGKDCGKK